VDKSPDAFRTISEVAEDLDLPQHVLRFWESRFAQIRPLKRGGGRRYYRPDDVHLLRGIRHLLYGEGYTIRGVQRILKEEGPRFVQTIWRDGIPGQLPPPQPIDLQPDELRSPIGEDDGDFDDDSADDIAAGADGRAPPRADRPDGAAQPAALPADALRQLHTALAELAECRRLIAIARGTADPEPDLA
jgi:DNA-binding transcriptional MerR regulator